MMALMRSLLTAFGRRVRELRRQQGQSLQALADTAGLSRRFLVEIEAGRANPSLAKLAALAQAFHLELSQLCDLPLPHPARRIALVGMRGAGKSSLGRIAAEALEIPFVELDQWVQEHAGMTSSAIFELEGAAGFRQREHEALEAWLSRHAEGVLAVAGGLAENEAAWNRLLASCTVIWLRATPQEHWDRVIGQGDSRPMRGLPDARARLEKLLTSREPAYSRAPTQLDTSGKTMAEASASLLRLLQSAAPAGASSA
jgi:XRE family aerobic/anaerobic benzoate catabolism transcriptional regulator